MTKRPDKPERAPAPVVLPRRVVELRGASGHRYGLLDVERRAIEFKRGPHKETIYLDDYLQER